MWVIFLLSAMTVFICGLAIAYVTNKVIISIQKDREKINKKRKKRSNKK